MEITENDLDLSINTVQNPLVLIFSALICDPTQLAGAI
jgi:hypothetical protein